MKIGIIVAMEKEMTLLLPLLENVKTLKRHTAPYMRALLEITK